MLPEIRAYHQVISRISVLRILTRYTNYVKLERLLIYYKTIIEQCINEQFNLRNIFSKHVSVITRVARDCYLIVYQTPS